MEEKYFICPGLWQNSSGSLCLVLFTEARPQSPFLSKTIGMRGDLEDQLTYVFQLPYRTTVAANASGL